MKTHRPLATLLALLAPLALAGCRSSAPAPPPIVWNDWSPAVFERARAEDRLVLLHLGAVWCHWCHVMEHETYEDPDVLRVIAEGYVPVYVDQDSRPDLSNRYEDYGWPATILFDAEAAELGKFRGYIPPGRMLQLLRAFREDPTPGPSALPEAEVEFGAASALAGDLREALEAARRRAYDGEHRGWGSVHKFLERGNVEYALVKAQAGDPEEERMARETLEAALQLFDPVWGGVYQYSHGGVWENPHFEKIMSFQADYLATYSLAYALWGEEQHLDAAREVHRYLTDFLMSPEGAFYTSQDADLVKGEHSGEYFALDDEERRALGMPAIDRNRYSRENGWVIDALCTFAAASGEPEPLEDALAAAEWVLAHRALDGGGFRHGEADEGGPFLGDTLAMGRAFTSLYALTGDVAWLERASAAARFIDEHFTAADGPGLLTARPEPGLDSGPFAPVRQYDENVAAARWLNLHARYTGDGDHLALARSALAWLATPAVARERRGFSGAILLTDLELATDPVHVTVVGPSGDEAREELFAAALALPAAYKRVERYDPSGPPLPNPDIPFPGLARPAAFVCANGACSSPIYAAEELAEAAARP